jgi:predicted ATPase/class 3 adenylate cyclase
MAAQPLGTVSLLFTDIEGSTQLLQRVGTKRYALLLDRHRRLLREAFAAHGGYEVDCEGDAFFVAFPSAAGAIDAAATAQRALASEAWPDDATVRVRVGVHTGEPLAAPPKYVGIDVHRAARIMSAAHGGQVLVSDTTRELLRDAGFRLRDLGEHRLKDLLEPIRLFQLEIDGLRTEFPPPHAIGSHTNLPQQPTPLIGRAGEVAELKALLGDPEVRLVTLTGAGGIGKTRLALHAAAELVDRYPSGTFVVPLAALRDPALVVPTIAQTIGLAEKPGEALRERLAEYLRNRRMLLVLDNFEQVIEAATEISAILAATDGPTVMVTSRQRLQLRGERVVVVPPLPTAPGHAELDELIRLDSVQLFVERARALVPRFRVERNSVSAVAELCVRLDGLPLAIELAAARTPILTPPELLRRLDRRLALLTAGARDAPSRHRTLRATVDWSYELLPSDQQAVFRQLSVFSGGCTVEAAEAVVDGTGEPEQILDQLGSLLDKSLLYRVVDEAGQTRFAMPETMRDYGFERLSEHGERERIQTRHAAWFVTFAQGLQHGRSAAIVEAGSLSLLAADIDNFRAALRFLSGSGAPERALRLASLLRHLWDARGYTSEGRHWLDELLAAGATADPDLRAEACGLAGRLAGRQGDFDEAVEHLRRSLALYREVGDTAETARTLTVLGAVHTLSGSLREARACLEEAARLRQELGDAAANAAVLNHLGILVAHEGDLERARALQEEALRIRRELDDDPGAVAVSAANLGYACIHLGDYETAERLFAEALPIQRAAGDTTSLANLLANMALLAHRRRQPVEAIEWVREAAQLFAEKGDRDGCAECISLYAAIIADEGSGDRPALLLGAAAAIRRRTGRSLAPAELDDLDRLQTELEERLGAEEFASAYGVGQSLPLEDAMAAILTAPTTADDPVTIGSRSAAD